MFVYNLRLKQISKILLVSSFSILIFLSFVVFKANNSTKVEAKPTKIDTIVIDPGHGGFDGGATSVDKKVLEKEINLKISLKLKQMLTKSGYKVVMTREKDTSTEDKLFRIIPKKKSDMKNRLKLADKSKTSLTVSIHQNTYTNSKYSGAQMFYGPKNPESKILAQIIQKKFVSMLQPDNDREIKKAGSNLYLLKNAENPIVLIECGFITNKKEATLLNDSKYQQKVANVICCAIIDYVNS